jgi:hypothetical protein
MGDGAGVSLLVPFREDASGTRTAPFEWLRAYYRAHLPAAEIVVGECAGDPYSKSIAVNDAARRSAGDIFAILDADTWLSPRVIERCAAAIRTSGAGLWFLPHRASYELCREDTACDPAQYDSFGVPTRYERRVDRGPGQALIISADGFSTVGGFDPRFRGWGGEDRAFVRAADTLYAEHRRTRDWILSLWHERPGGHSKSDRHWHDGMPYGDNRASHKLVKRYKRAIGNVPQMRALVDEGLTR